MKMKWWEKSVEYAFVLRHVKEEALIAPLSGPEERAGDAVFQIDESFILIEFKRSDAELDSEQSKFANGKYEEAYSQLYGRDSHHLLVYGKQDEADFDLHAGTYFSGRPVSLSSKLPGLPKEDFIKYMQLFLGFKVGAGSSGSGGSSLIAGVNEAGNVIGVMSNEEFIVKYLPEFVPPQLESEVGSDQEPKAGFSPGMKQASAVNRPKWR